MSYTIGDGMVAIALAAGILGYLYMKHQSRQKRIEIIHQERMLAMEKGIPLPEFPLEPAKVSRGSDPDNVIPILGTVLASLSGGAMIAFFLVRTPGHAHNWVAPLPFVFLGIGLIAYYLLKK